MRCQVLLPVTVAAVYALRRIYWLPSPIRATILRRSLLTNVSFRPFIQQITGELVDVRELYIP